MPAKNYVDLVIPHVSVTDALVDSALKLGFEGALHKTKRYWDARLAKGALIDVPDPVVVNLYKTLYPRTLVCGDLDVEGDYVLKTSPNWHEWVWLAVSASGIEGLARRGHFEQARRYLDAIFRWQDSSGRWHFRTLGPRGSGPGCVR